MRTAKVPHPMLSRRPIVTCLPLVMLIAGCSLDRILEVELPGVVTEEALDDPKLAVVITNSAIGGFECAWNQYTALASYHSDEWIPSSTTGHFVASEWGRRGTSASSISTSYTCTTFGGIFIPLQTARAQGDDVYRRLGTLTVANRAKLQAIARAYGGYALVGLAESYCSMALDGGPRLTPLQVMAEAESRFGEALTIVQQAGDTIGVQGMARVGRARARLYRGDFAGAIADAQAVAAGYLRAASRGDEEPRRRNYSYEYLTGETGGPLMYGSVAETFRGLTVNALGAHTRNAADTPDPRLVIATTGRNGQDSRTPHFFHQKYPARSTPVPIASYKEAQLIIAEAAARSGDLTTARAAINGRHAAAGLPPWDLAGAATQAEIIRHVLDERARELFNEGGWRLSDMLRFRATPYQIPFRGEPGSIHPNGVDQTGLAYGTTTCIPLPAAEEQGNPNLSGS